MPKIWYWYLGIFIGLIIIAYPLHLLFFNNSYKSLREKWMPTIEKIGAASFLGFLNAIGWFLKFYIIEKKKYILYVDIYLSLIILLAILYFIKYYKQVRIEKKKLEYFIFIVSIIIFILFSFPIALIAYIILFTLVTCADWEGHNVSKKKSNHYTQQQGNDLENYYERERLKNIPEIRLKEDDYK